MRDLKAFVLMPYGSQGEYEGGVYESQFIFEEIIKPGILGAVGKREGDVDAPEVIREMDRNQGGSITTSLVRSIVTSDIVVVDITGRNPNVFLELGMRYALRSKTTILIAQENTEVPFDIQGYRYIRYNRFRPREAREKIASFIRQGLVPQSQGDSVVFDVFPNMSVVIPEVDESYGAEAAARGAVMPWSEYLRRIDYICGFLEPPIKEGRFVPDAILGITNGGLIVADLIGRKILGSSRIPILALWAKRTVSKFFPNSYNNATMSCVKREVKKTRASPASKPASILVFDDHTGSGQTATQAVEYIRSRLGEQTQVVYIPLVSRSLGYIEVIAEFLPYNIQDRQGLPVFHVEEQEFLDLLNTQAAFFPYQKKQIHIGAPNIED